MSPFVKFFHKISVRYIYVIFLLDRKLKRCILLPCSNPESDIYLKKLFIQLFRGDSQQKSANPCTF
ncbi:MAG: hypothetical protein CVV44_02885 [Spirochaetae bacterium HGW-Spirochaetae-1]|nr:MAG: hypothetical protein CVV44_02885 [Spirochaetae bacterium HGW-Spirochaetae-1]